MEGLKKQKIGLFRFRVNAPLIGLRRVERGLLPMDFRASRQSVYRLLKQSGVVDELPRKGRRRFEAELTNDLWQSDCMHGPKVEVGGKLRKSFLFAFIDDHSSLIPRTKLLGKARSSAG